MVVARRIQIIGLALLAVVTVFLTAAAITQFRGSESVTADPVPTPAPPTLDATTPTPTPTTATPAPSDPPTSAPVRKGLAGLADLLAGDDGGSVMVLGDGSGDATDEWVRIWAVDHVGKQGKVSYRSWNSGSSKWRAANPDGGDRAVTIWNASQRAPDLKTEPARVAKAWRPADVVLLSYGHRKTADTIGKGLTAIRKAVLKQNPDANIIVLIQNPDPVASQYVQLATTDAVKAWAKANRLPTVNLYAAFVNDPAPRSLLVEADGSPTKQGSQLWAKTLQAAIDKAG